MNVIEWEVNKEAKFELDIADQKPAMNFLGSALKNHCGAMAEDGSLHITAWSWRSLFDYSSISIILTDIESYALQWAMNWKNKIFLEHKNLNSVVGKYFDYWLLLLEAAGLSQTDLIFCF